MSFAIIETGGKQYKVAKGDVLDIERLTGAKGKELKEGDKVVFDKVLLLDDGKQTTVGSPYIKGKKVEATFVSEDKGKKVTGVKFKNKTGGGTRFGHRHIRTKVKLGDVK